MISLCILLRDVDITPLVDMFSRHVPCDWELCVGDNSTNKDLSKKLKEMSDEYVEITDKELFRMGIPWAQNKISSVANSYNIFYLDADEYPVWINLNVESMFDLNHVIPALRYDFLTNEEIYEYEKRNLSFDGLTKELRTKFEYSMQDRVYNCRYARFEGVCHAIFHVLDHQRGKEASCVILHNKTVRDTKNKKRMDELIDEQFANQNVNPFLASSTVVHGWGKGMKHKYDSWIEFVEAYK